MIQGREQVRADRLAREYGLKCNLYVKCEYFNAGGSVKDRIAKRMVEEAEKDGKLIPGKSVIIEPTSGNTGIGLALQAAVRGYRCIICLPEKMSQEKQTVLMALGAEVIRTPNDAGPDDPRSHIQVAARLAREIPGGIVLDQYANLANPEAHYYGTAAEIIEDIKSTVGISAKLTKLALTSGLANGLAGVTPNGHSSNGHQVDGHQLNGHAGRQSSGMVDLMFVGAGTGGSISGISKRLKEEWVSTQVIGIDPIGSILAQPDSLNILKEGESNMYAVEGIGYDFIPQVLDRKLVDSWIKVDDKQAFEMARKLIRAEGLLIGGSSGSNMAGTIRYLTETEAGKDIAATEGKNVVVLMPDSIRNYISKPWLLAPKEGEQ